MNPDTTDDVRAAMESLGKETTNDAPAVENNVVEQVPPAGSGDGDGGGADAGDRPVAADGRARGPDGKFTKKSETPAPKPEAKAVTPAPVAEQAAATVPPAPGAETATPAVKPPQSWKATVREKWALLPPEVQAEVARREQEVAQTLQGVAEAKKAHEQLQRETAPFEGLFRARGTSATKAVVDLLPTAAILHTGSPQEKAQALATAIKTFGVPVEMLAAALDGQPAQAQPQAVDPATIAQQVERQIMERLQQQHAAAERQRAVAEVEKFAAQAEFLDDVREDMADLIEAASKRGRAMTYQEAYDKATKLHPEISQVLAQREAAKTAQAKVADAAKAKAAASSVRSQPAISPAAQREAVDTVDDVRAALAALAGR